MMNKNDNVQEVHDKFNDVVLEQEQEDEILPDEQDDTFLFSKASFFGSPKNE